MSRESLTQTEQQALSRRLSKLGSSQRARISTALTPKLTKYIRIEPFPKQTAFLLLDNVQEVLYGGAGFGGKTLSLLAAALQYVDMPNYHGLLLRRTYGELTKPDGLLELAGRWLGGTDAAWNGLSKSYKFPVGSSLTFGYMDVERDKFSYQGTNWQYIGFDEITQMLQSQYQFLFGWLRKTEDMKVPLRMRGATNPVGPGRLWVKQYFIDAGPMHGRVFIPAMVDDNPYANKEAYRDSLNKLDPITREQILHGNWEAQAGGKFRRHWFNKFTDAVPADTIFVRYWDLASTEPAPGKDPSWTVGALVGMHEDERSGFKRFFVADLQRDRLTPRGVEDLVFQTAEMDGTDVAIRMEQEPGSSGVDVVNRYQSLLAKYDFRPDKVTGPKEIRANAFASQVEAGNVFVLKGRSWLNDMLDEFSVFPGGGHDDIVVAVVGAYNCLVSRNSLDIGEMISNNMGIPDRVRPPSLW